MSSNPKATFSSVHNLEDAPFLKALESAGKLDITVRSLSPGGITRLEAQGCRCDDWSLIKVAEGFDPARVHKVCFRGENILGRLQGEITIGNTIEPSSLERITIENCWIGDGAVIRDTGLLSNMHIGAGVAIIGCGRMTHTPNECFGIGTVVDLVETGERFIRWFPEMTVEDADRLARMPQRQTERVDALQWIDQYANRAASAFGVIEDNAQILETPRLENAFIGVSSRILSAQRLSDCVILSDSERPVVVEDGSIVKRSLLQWNSCVTSQSLVEMSLLCEASVAERHAKISQSVIGLNTSIGEGEVTSSLLGPFVGMHHQSLLISVFWPEGKGNVGSGCQCGSNHTSREPDQEFWPGEGMFLGLGVNVKFPGCFTQAPYTIIATGITLPPQRVEFPFSLILQPVEQPKDFSEDLNEIIPAWVLSDNLFVLARNERKFIARDRAKSGKFEHRVIRRETVELMKTARKRLQETSDRDYYTENEIPGLGRNLLAEYSRGPAVEAYTFHISLYALEGFFERCERLGEVPDGILTSPSDDTEWEHQRLILQEEELGSNPRALIESYTDSLHQMALRVEESKSRDDTRGKRIIPDYTDHHVPADSNPLVLQFRNELTAIETAATRLLEKA